MKQKMGRASREDGDAAEFVRHVPTEVKGCRSQAVLETLSGARPQPPYWRRASVTLIAQVMHVLASGDVRPIMVLSTSVKLGAVNLWLEAATPYVPLRKPSSHGFRPSYQAARVTGCYDSLQRNAMTGAYRSHWSNGAYVRRMALCFRTQLMLVLCQGHAVEATVRILAATRWTRPSFPHTGCVGVLLAASQSGHPTGLSGVESSLRHSPRGPLGPGGTQSCKGTPTSRPTHHHREYCCSGRDV